MQANDETRAPPLLSPEELRRLQQRSDQKGLLRLAGHLAAILGSGALYAAALRHPSVWPLALPAAVLYGFTLVTMFAALHECVHRTAFKSAWLSNAVGWSAGVLSFYNSTFYRYYHGWHHRFTQLPGKDPELDDLKPTSLGRYLAELSGVPWWVGKLRTYATIALGQVGAYVFLNVDTRLKVVRSVRLQLLVYLLAIALSVALAQPLFVTYWLLPVAAGQPLLRAILMAEHTGCSEDDNPLTNTRTTHTVLPVRFLMWEMPYHAEHHRYPALPFFALGRAHSAMGGELAHVARGGYWGVHKPLLAGLLQALRAPEHGDPRADREG